MTKSVTVAVLSLTLLLSGCDGSVTLDRIETRALYSQQTLRLEISSPKAEGAGIANGNLAFTSDQSLEEMKAIADEQNFEKVELSERSLFLSRQGLLQDTKDYYIIQRQDQKEESNTHYTFSGSAISLTYDVTDEGVKILELLFPLQYLKSSYYRNSSLYTQQTYESTKGADDFFRYYEESGWFELEKDDTGMTILDFKENRSPSDPDRQLPGKIRFTFAENEGTFAFTMSIE